ncbi:MAG TPA: hypothetical protein DDX92_00920 [Flavobacteriales bacterium]|jgi:predicted transcriptional regulator|nr:hypothetical protein [Flavobacteriales bacterium]
MNKQSVIDALNDMPNSFEFDELIERLLILEKIAKGRKDVEQGRVFSHEEAKEQILKWPK